VCSSNGLANHPCGLNHGIVDAIECFDVVTVSKATHCFGLHLVNVDDTANTRHRGIHKVLLVLPASRHVVGSTRWTEMSQKEVVGCGGRRYSYRKEERSVHSIGHIGRAVQLTSGIAGQAAKLAELSALLSAKAGDTRGRGE